MINETVIKIKTDWTLADLDALIGGEQAGGQHERRGFTMRELQASTGKSQETITKRLLALKAAGKLSTGKEYREGIDGQMHVTTVYYIG